MVEIKNMAYADMLELRFQLNKAIEDIERVAFTALQAGEECTGFVLKAGRATRFIADTSKFTQILKNTFEDSYTSLCTETKELPLTRIEKLVKSQFDSDDSSDILLELNDTLGIKQSDPKLTYTGEPSGK